ncbi:hypothetical protein [Phocaeicola sp.]
MEYRIIIFKRFLKFSGVFNIIAATFFIFPQLYKFYIVFYNEVNEFLRLGGTPISIPINPFHELMINTAGIDLVLIGSIILFVSNNPIGLTNRKIIISNGIGRLLFFFIVGYYSIYDELLHIIIPFAVIDFFIALIFFYLLYKTK